MHVSSKDHRLELPTTLETQLLEFRKRLWLVKLIEAGCGALFGVLAAFLIVFLLDRWFDTPAGIRAVVFVVAIAACALVPLAIHRWIWQRRKLEQLARLLGRRYPSIGDQILGIIELVRSESEQARSRALCEAAIDQVAKQADRSDFSDAVPNPRHKLYALMAGGVAVVGLVICLAFPAASMNAWARFLMPWSETPRYTFVQVEPLPDRMVVPHGEPFDISVQLHRETASQPASGEVQLKSQTPVGSKLQAGGYSFSLPPQIDDTTADVRIGDFSQEVQLEPTRRPELESVIARVSLPEYLQRPGEFTKDVRGGVVSLVNGSRATFVATATRELASASIDGSQVQPAGAQLVTPTSEIDGDRQVELTWRDGLGLAGGEPFTLAITGRADQAPSVSCAELPRQKVVLDSEHLTFVANAQDDFGIRNVGFEWMGVGDPSYGPPAQGEHVIAAGGPTQDLLEVKGTFTARALGITPQPIELRLFVEDYHPERGRVYSAPYVLYVLDPEQHAIWLTEQLNKWHRQSLDVRDRELQLYETNKQLRELAVEELDAPETRRRIETQASAERTNGRRLARLSATGEDLIQQAMRNPQFGVGHLENWAEMLQVLKDISSNRMPSVADLLRQASQAPQMAASKSESKSGPMAGMVRAAGGGQGAESEEEEAESKPPVPSLVDLESTQQPEDDEDGDTPSPPSSGSPRLTLPTTTLLGGKSDGEACPVGEKVEEAVEEQKELLAEFEKIADELNRLLANMEGSTLVKRLKAASRVQYRVAGALADQVDGAFGVATASVADQKEVFVELATQEQASSQDVSHIMDDMQAYFERRRFMQFKNVLDEMQEVDVVGSLRQLSDGLARRNGLSMAQCEYWSDSLDRWAEDLVEPTSGGT